MKNKKIALKIEEQAGDEVSLKDAIERLNALYAAVCENANTVRNMFTAGGIKNKFGFYNNHAVAIDDGYINELYPIPIVTAERVGVAVDIGFDIVSRNGNIGFVELTVDKTVLVGIDFSRLAQFEFAIYGVEQYLTEYWFGDAAQALAQIKESDEKQFHIGIEFVDMAALDRILDIFFGGVNGLGGDGAGAPLKMLDKK